MKKIIILAIIAFFGIITVSYAVIDNDQYSALQQQVNYIYIKNISNQKKLVFRSTQKLCYKNELIILRGGGGIEIYVNSTLLYKGTYNIESQNVIVAYVQGGTFRMNANMDKNKTKVRELTFEGKNYYPCDR